MALPYDIAPPAWLTNEVQWARTGRERDLANALTQMKIQEGQMNLAQGALGLQQQEQSLELGRVKLQGLSQDTEQIPQWLSEHPTEESRRSAAWPVARTPEWERNLNQLRIADSRSVSQKAAVEDVSLFNKRLAGLTDAGSRAAIKGMTANKDGTPSAIQWQALGYAEDAARIAAENEKARLANQSETERQTAVAAAAARGDKISTSIGPKGVTTTTTTVPETSTLTPKSLDIGNGNKIVWMPGAKTLHIVKPNGSKDEFTVPQMRAFAGELKERKDPFADKIIDFLKQKMEEKITPKDAAKDVNGLPPKPDAGTAPAMPKISTKAERDALKPGTQYIGPDGKTYTRQ